MLRATGVHGQLRFARFVSELPPDLQPPALALHRAVSSVEVVFVDEGGDERATTTAVCGREEQKQ